MTIYIIGGGWYGCHIAKTLMHGDYDVKLIESSHRLFNGASGNNPARLHLGFHYPRSYETRIHCLSHYRKFMDEYGFLTQGVPINIYAIAKETSYIDFGTYTQVLQNTNEFIRIENPSEFGLTNVEGAILTGERHILIDSARSFFETELKNIVSTGLKPEDISLSKEDILIDCTFSALSEKGIDRFEPCLTVLLKGPTDKAITIMDGPFPSLYPWNENKGLCSLTSALHTPFSKECRSYYDAQKILSGMTQVELYCQSHRMIKSMSEFYPDIWHYSSQEWRTAIRAMPLSGADSRLVNIDQEGRTIRVRAGKIDAIMSTADQIKERIDGLND